MYVFFLINRQFLQDVGSQQIHIICIYICMYILFNTNQ